MLVRGGVHTPQTDTIIDVQVIYLNAPSTSASRARRNTRKRGRPKEMERVEVREEMQTTESTVSGRDGNGVRGAEGAEGEPSEEGAVRTEDERDEERSVQGRPVKGSVDTTTHTRDHATAVLRTQEKVKELKHKAACNIRSLLAVTSFLSLCPRMAA